MRVSGPSVEVAHWAEETSIDHFRLTAPGLVYTTYNENFLALSVSIRLDKHHQLMMETSSRSQAPVLRYRDIIITAEHLKESLSAVCPLLGIHNVARVRQGAALPLVEVDFANEKNLEIFCKSISNGMFNGML